MINIIKGNIISSDSLKDLNIYSHSYLISENGIIKGIYKEIPEEYKNEKIDDYGDMLIIQSFSDMHLHAPQFPMLGLGMDLELLDWLKEYTFPLEAKFKDVDYARNVYQKFAKALIEAGTTRVAMFSSLHTDSTIVLMEELENAGISGYVGKVNMDRNSIPELIETTSESIDETLRWLTLSEKFKNIKPIITPRFTPSCTDELMAFLGKIASENNLPIQSHMSENEDEISWVKKLHPDTKSYYESYQKYGLWNSKTLMAHCVHSDEKELLAIKEAGVYVVHCASSNENLLSGYAPIRHMLNMGINVVLGSDIAGGDHLSMFDNVTASIRASKARSIMENREVHFLKVKEAFYLATSAANKYFGEKEGFAPGNKLNALVINDTKLLNDNLSLMDRFDRLFYCNKKAPIEAIYANGKRVK